MCCGRFFPLEGILLYEMANTDQWEEFYDNMNSEEQKTAEALADMAEEWYDSITREQVRTRMMVNYIVGITDDMTREEARQMLIDQGVIDG